LAGDVAIADTGLYIVAPHSLAACRTAKVAEYQTYSAFAHEMLSGSRVASHTSSLCSKAPVHSLS